MNIKEAIRDIIKSRRSVFPAMFSNERIPDETIREILELGTWAPTHRKTEPWYFKVYTDKALKKLSDYAGQWYKDHTDETSFSEMKYNKTKAKPLQSSHVVAIILERHEGVVPEWEEIAAIGCAVQNIWLAISAYGYGCYWSTPGFAIRGKDFFKLTDTQRCLGLIYMGLPKKNLQLEGQRQNINAKISWMSE